MAEPLSQAEYEELADLRFQIRRFLHFSESVALAEGIEPRHHQALLAIKAMPADEPCTIGSLAARLFLQHQSTVGLVDRMEQRNLVVRTPGRRDARQVLLSLTSQGERLLERLSATHKTELAQSAPELARALRSIMRRAALVPTE